MTVEQSMLNLNKITPPEVFTEPESPFKSNYSLTTSSDQKMHLNNMILQMRDEKGHFSLSLWNIRKASTIKSSNLKVLAESFSSYIQHFLSTNNMEDQIFLELDYHEVQ